MKKTNQIDLTSGPIFSSMVRFSVPIMVQGSFQIIYNLTDRFWLGHLSKEAVASVAVVFPVLFFMISVVIGISIGAGILIAQYYGFGDRERINLTARNYLVVGGIFVIFVSILMILGAGNVLGILETPEDIRADSESYLKIQFAGLIFLFAYFGCNSVFRGLGDSFTPTKVAAVTGLVNLVLDPLLIFGIGPFPRMEVAGAAVATVIAYIVGAIIIFIQLAVQQNDVDLSPRGFRFDYGIIAKILQIGLPTSGTLIVVSGSFMVLMRIVNEFGTDAIAAWGILVVLDQLLMMPSQSFGMSMNTIAGQNMGAGNLDRVRSYLRATNLLSAGTAIVFGGLTWLAARPLTSLFLENPQDAADVAPYVVMYIKIVVIRYLFMAFFFPINGVIRGAGDAMASMWMVLLTQLLINIPMAYYISIYLGHGFIGIPIAMTLSAFIGLIIAVGYYHTGIWIRRGKYVLDRVNSTVSGEIV